MKRIISIMLVIAMMASLCCIGAYAQGDGEDDELVYVALGDSTSLGYYMDSFCDFYKRADDMSQTALWSTYRMFGDYLRENVKDRTVVTKDLAFTGMRPAELRAILDPDYYALYNDGNKWSHANYLDEHIDYYSTEESTGDGGARGYGSYEALHEAFVENLSKADIITYDLSMVDYGGYFSYRLMSMSSSFYTQDSFASIMQQEGYPVIAQSAEALGGAVKAILEAADLSADMIDQFLNALLYCYASFAINFSKSIDLIYDLNPDAEIIVVGPFNTMDGVVFTYGDFEIDLGLIWGLLMESLTTHIVAVDCHKNQYRFADLRDGIGMCIDTMASGNYDGYNVLYNLLMEDDAVKMLKGLGMSDEEITAAIAKGASPEPGEDSIYIPLEDLIPLLTSGDPMEAMTDYALPALRDIDNATPAQKALIHVYLRLIITHATGCHPNIDGYCEKTAAIVGAYESDYTADGTYIARAVEDTFDLAEAVLKYLAGIPGKLVTKEIAAEALYTLAGSPDVSGMSEPFADVYSSGEHYNAIVWAYNNGIMSGTSAHIFAPSMCITRSYLASILYKYAGSPEAGKPAMKDKNVIVSAHRTAAAWAVENGVMSINSLGYFNPGLIVTRDELSNAIKAM